MNTEINADSAMEEVLVVFPGARRALFRKYHIGGCSSCGFKMDETLGDICDRNNNLDVGEGLAIRHDHGTAYLSDTFQAELAFLGIESSPAFVREPEGNGCAERFIRILKENLLWVQTFANVEELRNALHEFKERYNREWILERHDYMTPRQAAEAAALGVVQAA